MGECDVDRDLNPHGGVQPRVCNPSEKAMTRRTAILAAATLGGLPKLAKAAAPPAKTPTWWMEGSKLESARIRDCEVTGDKGMEIVFVQHRPERRQFQTMRCRMTEWIHPDATPYEVAAHLRKLADQIEKF